MSTILRPVNPAASLSSLADRQHPEGQIRRSLESPLQHAQAAALAGRQAPEEAEQERPGLPGGISGLLRDQPGAGVAGYARPSVQQDQLRDGRVFPDVLRTGLPHARAGRRGRLQLQVLLVLPRRMRQVYQEGGGTLLQLKPDDARRDRGEGSRANEQTNK